MEIKYSMFDAVIFTRACLFNNALCFVNYAYLLLERVLRRYGDIGYVHIQP